MCFIFLVCAFLIWVEKWGSTCQHSCLDIMVGDAATFLPLFFVWMFIGMKKLLVGSLCMIDQGVDMFLGHLT